MKTKVMGIVNLTPDSFFAASRAETEAQIAKRVETVVAEGGEIIDVGACSTRPGSQLVTEKEEMRRLREGLAIITRMKPRAALSVDTFRPEVARMAVEEFGVTMINDVGSAAEPQRTVAGSQRELSKSRSEMFGVVGRLKVKYVLMSRQPTVETIITDFRSATEQLRACGCNDIILDPGYGFGKGATDDKPTTENDNAVEMLSANYAVLARQAEIKAAFPDLPLLVGVSRKRMIYQTLGTTADESLNGTTAVHILALERGADILRVHDVKAAVEACKIYEKLQNTN